MRVNMSTYEIYRENINSIMGFEEIEKFLEAIELLIKLGIHFTVAIAKEASNAFKEVKKIFAEHNIDVALSVDSDPEAADYIANAMFGSAIGMAAGAAFGAGFWVGLTALVAKGASFTVPGFGQVVLISTIIGTAVGGLTGAAITRYGLKIRFKVKDNKEFVVADYVCLDYEHEAPDSQ